MSWNAGRAGFRCSTNGYPGKDPGVGNSITWVTPENCQAEDFAVDGVFYISAYVLGTDQDSVRGEGLT